MEATLDKKRLRVLKKNKDMRIDHKYKATIFEVNEKNHRLIMEGKVKVKLLPTSACRNYFYSRFNVSGDFIGDGKMLSIEDKGVYFYYGNRNEANLPEIQINDLVIEKRVEKTISWDTTFFKWMQYKLSFIGFMMKKFLCLHNKSV